MSDEKPPPTIPQPIQDPDVGDWVYLVFWRPFPMPGNDKNGSWQAYPVRVVIGGKKRICVEVTSSFPSHLGGDEEALAGSPHRFVDPQYVYPYIPEVLERVLPTLQPPKA